MGSLASAGSGLAHYNSSRMDLLRPDDVGELRRLVHSGKALPRTLPPPTLGAVIELACTASVWRAGGELDAVRSFQEWAAALPLLGDAWSALNGERPVGAVYSATTSDVCSVTDTDAQAFFGNRFRESLIAIGGFTDRFALELAGAMQEMIDNTFQHSTTHPGRAAPAVMGFEVAAQSFSFAVGDVGRGALDSLRENPQWATLPSDDDALHAIIVRHASRRGPVEGTGFQQVVRALADLGTFRLRSGSACVSIVANAGAHSRTAIQGASFPLIGAQIVVESAKNLTAGG